MRTEVFKKLLVPVDDSVSSLVAQELAALIAKEFESSVTVFYVVSHEFMNPEFVSLVGEVGVQEYAPSQIARGEFSMPRLIPLPTGGGAKASMISEVSNWYHQKGDEIVAEAVRLFKEEGIPVERKVIDHQNPASAILREADGGDYDAIVIGRSGEKDQEKQVRLGSTAGKVVRHAKIPVLVAAVKRNILKILIPYDGSRGGDKALEYGIALAKALKAKGTLLYVQESGLFTAKPEVAKAIGERVLSKAGKMAKGVAFDQKIESGNVGKVITETADKENFDIIIMGSKGRGGVQRFLMGSASNHVLHYANHTVLLAK